MPQNYSCTALGALFKEQCNLAKENIVQRIERMERPMMQAIPDGGMVGPNENSDSLIWSHAPINYIDYRRRSAAGSTPGLVPGQMLAGICDGTNEYLDANVSELSGKGCQTKRVTVEFNNGYRRMTALDFNLPIITNIYCANTYEKYAPSEVAEMFVRERQMLEEWAVDNFEVQLRNAAIEFGQSNSSVIAGESFNVATGGWVAPPTGVLTIAFLKQWGRRWRALSRPGRLVTNNTERNFPVTVRLPEADWRRMVNAHATNVYGSVTVNMNYGEDPFNQKFETYDGVRWIQDEFPIRGYFDGGRFIEIPRVIPDDTNVEAGVGGQPNPDYDNCWAYCNGLKRRVVTMIQIVDPMAFQRKGLKLPWSPTKQSSNNMDLRLIEGNEIFQLLDCGDNLDNNQWAYMLRHEWRFLPKFPELAGSIVYLHDNPCPYDITPCCDDSCPTVYDPDNFQNGPKGSDEAQGSDDCTIAHCVQCGSEYGGLDGHTCTDTEVNELTLSSTGTVSTIYSGTSYQVVVKVCRKSNNDTALALTYVLTPGTALLTTHYTDGSLTPGTLNWAANENTCKSVILNIVGSSGDPEIDLSFVLDFATPAGVTYSNSDQVTIEIGHCGDL